MALRALELFCGIGGFAAAMSGTGLHPAGALDQSEAALSVYRHNFPDHPIRPVDLERVSAWELTSYAADFWWLSPPCQPYCERGCRRDLDDPRARSLLRLLELLGRIPADRMPRHLALENVVGFVTSQARQRLLDLLAGRGYQVQDRIFCPTMRGVPSRRPRYYLTASLKPLRPVASVEPPVPLHPLSAYLDRLSAPLDPGLRLRDEIVSRFGSGLRILDAADSRAYTTCFTSGYGKSVSNAGSYLRHGDGVRYFSPEEIARLLHFPEHFRFPEGMPLRMRWRLVGNSLSVVAVREVLQAFPELADQGSRAAVS